MHLIGNAPFSGAMPMLSGIGDAAPTSSSLRYAIGEGNELILTVGEPTPLNLALLASAFSLQPATVGEQAAWLGSIGSVRAVAWVRDRHLFVVIGGGSSSDLVAFAASVRQPTVEEWHRLVGAHGASASAETDSTVVDENPPDTVPADTAPTAPTEMTRAVPQRTVPDSGHDVPVTLDVRAVTPNDVVISAEATGVTSTVDVAVAAGIARFSAPDAGGNPIDLSADDPQLMGWGGSHGDGMIAITSDASAMALWVTTTTGKRYVVGLVSVPARPDVRFAAIVVPAGTSVRADLVDADGNVLAELSG